MPIDYSPSTKDRVALAHRALDAYAEAMKKPKIRDARNAAEILLKEAVFLAHASGLLPEGRIFYEDPRRDVRARDRERRGKQMKKELLGVIVKPLFDIPAGVMATAALVTCCRCGAAVRGMGGPMDDVLCLPCARIGLMPDECHSEGKCL